MVSVCMCVRGETSKVLSIYNWTVSLCLCSCVKSPNYPKVVEAKGYADFTAFTGATVVTTGAGNNA